MKEIWLVLTAALRAAAWKPAPAPASITIRTVLVCSIVAMAAEAARQYVAIEDDAAFSIYGVNTLIAQAAVLAAIGLLFVPAERTGALARLLVLVALTEAATIALTRSLALTIVGALGAAVFICLVRRRTAVIWKLFAIGGVLELTLSAARHLPAPLMPGFITAAAVLLGIVLLVWWIGAVAAIFRGCLGPEQRPLLRAVAFTTLSMLATAASPAYPTFIDRYAEPSSYNLWEWTRARLAPAAAEPAHRLAADDVDLSQPRLLEAEVDRLLPQRKGTADVYAIGIAGWSDQDVFVKELNGGLAALDQSLGLDRGTIRLVNHVDTTETLPIANRSNFAAAVHSVAKVMDKNEDILVIFITSHGGPDGVALRLAGAVYTILSPDHIATVLDREGIKNRLIIVSACYSGAFATRLASPDSVVLTAADANSPSFGCSNEREWTYFGDALFNQNLATGISLEQAFNKAKEKIAQWEARDRLSPSNPQGSFGAALTPKLRAKAGADDAHHARPDKR